MPSKIRTTLISALGVMFLFTGMAFARTKRIDVIYHSMVGKSLKLKPGKYRIDVATNAKKPVVKFYNHYGKLVGQAPVKLVETQKNGQTEVDYEKVASNDHVITEISPRGWRENLYFSQWKSGKKGLKK